jgi:glycosyltransferase involved in cell wall biosynthesis
VGADPLFSVVVTTHGAARFLPEALESLFAQTVQDFECIIVVDGGRMPSNIPTDPRVRVVYREVNGGYPAALNTGLKHARGSYLTVLDHDDLFTPERLELGLEGMKRTPLAVCWRANPGTGKAGRNRILEGFVHDVILDRPIPTLGQTTALRTAVLPFDERLRNCSDVEWWLRMSQRCEVATEPKVGLMLRRHQHRTSLNVGSRVLARALIFDKHEDYFRLHPRAAARFLERNGSLARTAGYYDLARRDLWRALRLRPKPTTLLRLMRAALGSGQRSPDTSPSSP